MAERAHYDSLTALPGPARLVHCVERTIARAERTHERFALLVIGLDWSGSARVKLQHGARERLLIEIARRLRVATRKSDTVARLGEAEFGVLLHGAYGESAASVADKVAAALSTPVADGDCKFMVHAATGLADFPEHGRSATDLLRHANDALCEATQGANDRQLYPGPRLPLSRRLQLGTRLRASLASGEGLSLNWRPLVRLADGIVTGAEAVPRWGDREQGTVEGPALIELATHNGLAIEFDRWALELAVRSAAPWLNAGDNRERAVVVVDLSATYLRRDHTPDEILATLRRHGLRPEQVELDVAEHIVVDLGAAAWQVFHALGSAGVRLAVDDFGSTQSNLGNLARLAPDRLKLGPALVHNVGSSSVDRAVVAALAFLGRNLAVEVVADAVEGVPQLELLRDLGCAAAQGPLFGPPAELAALPACWAAAPTASDRDRD